MPAATQIAHEPGVDLFTARPEEVEAILDPIVAANRQQGLLTLVTKQEQETGLVQVTCVAFAIGGPDEGTVVIEETEGTALDRVVAESPKEGSAPAELEI